VTAIRHLAPDDHVEEEKVTLVGQRTGEQKRASSAVDGGTTRRAA
jgi:hypothetical protein